jgi:hypothetical protein
MKLGRRARTSRAPAVVVVVVAVASAAAGEIIKAGTLRQDESAGF